MKIKLKSSTQKNHHSLKHRMQTEQIATVKKHRHTHTSHAHILCTLHIYTSHAHIPALKVILNLGRRKTLDEMINIPFQQRFPEGFESKKREASTKDRRREEKEGGGGGGDVFSSSSLQQRNRFQKNQTSLSSNKEIS